MQCSFTGILWCLPGPFPLRPSESKGYLPEASVVSQCKGQGRCFQSCCREANRPGHSSVSVCPMCSTCPQPAIALPLHFAGGHTSFRSPPPRWAVERGGWAAVLPGTGLTSVPVSRKDLWSSTPESTLATGCWAELGKWSMGWKACPSVALLFILASVELCVFSQPFHLV